jgi:hypothetical protein
MEPQGMNLELYQNILFCCNSATTAILADNQLVASGSKVADVAANSDFNRKLTQKQLVNGQII